MQAGMEILASKALQKQAEKSLNGCFRWLMVEKVSSFSKKRPGLKTKYLSVNGTICKLKEKSCTYSDYYRGKRTKKKLKVKIATAKSDKYRGIGAAVTKTITLR